MSKKICVVGAGSIGGLLGVKLALAGHDVTLIARGANLAAIKANGMKLVMGDGTEHHAQGIKATDKISEAGPQDIVILGMKAHQVEAVIGDLPSLFHENTIVLPMQNGIPFWYFERQEGPYKGRTVTTVDPKGNIASAIDPKRILGCVVYPAAEIAEPGVIHHIEGDRFPIGELDSKPGDAPSVRAQEISDLLTQAGFKAPVLDNVRAEIWLKLWGNLTFNPISALTHSTLVDICQYPLTRELATRMMEEAQAVANTLGITFRVNIEKRIAGAERVGKHKTSMLQDVEAGRDPEIDALVGSVIELGKIIDVPTPHIEAVYALVKLLGRTMREEKIYIRANALA